jgi:hypothetical protein
METHTHNHENGKGRRATIGRLVLIGFALVAGYFLITEHRAHLFGALPFLLLAACPLMHLFHHGGHGHSRHDEASGVGEEATEKKPNSGAGGPEHLDH